MGALILGIVLIIGYKYQSDHPIRRLKLVRSTGYHIYFKAGLSGFILLFISLVVWVIIDFNDWPSKIVEWSNLENSLAFIKNYKDWVELKAVIITIMMALLSEIYTRVSRVYYHFSPEKFLDKVFLVANEFESLVIDATPNVDLIRLELESGKIYVGVPDSPTLEDGVVAYIKLIPFLGGYRDDDNKIIFTSNYQEHYAKEFSDDNDAPTKMRNFEIIIPTKDVVVASRFDLEAFVKIQNAPNLQ